MCSMLLFAIGDLINFYFRLQFIALDPLSKFVIKYDFGILYSAFLNVCYFLYINRRILQRAIGIYCKMQRSAITVFREALNSLA